MSLFRQFFTVSFFISLSRVLGFVRDILIAKYLGVSMLSDAFFAAFRLPNFFRRVFAEGAFNSAFVPIFVERINAKNGYNLASDFARNIFSLLFYILLILVIIAEIFMPEVTGFLFPGFLKNQQEFMLTVSLSRITIFYLLFISLVSLCSGILNSLNKFAVPAASPIILNSSLIFAVIIFGKMAPTYAHSLAYGVFVAGILQFLWVFIFTMRAKILLYPTLPKFGADTKVFFRKLVPGVIGANVMQINLLVDNIIASLIVGAVSYLYYADRINQLPLAMIGIAIGTALLPNLSLKIRNGKFEEAVSLQNKALEVGLMLVIPATLALVCLSDPIITTLFKRGAFGDKEAEFVARALQFYSLGLPSYVLVKVMEPSFFCRGNTKTPMIIAMICLVNNVIFNLIFYKIFHLGYIGIVLSSVISSYLNLTLLISLLIKKHYFYFEKGFLTKLLKIIIPAILMAIILNIISDYFGPDNNLSQIVKLTIMISVGFAVYGVASIFSGSFRIFLSTNLFKRKKNKIKIYE
jgi:putative peptidoglycan lipid II flippase